MRRQYELWRAALQVQRVFQKVDRTVSHGMYGGADITMGAQKNDRQHWFASQKQCALNFQA